MALPKTVVVGLLAAVAAGALLYYHRSVPTTPKIEPVVTVTDGKILPSPARLTMVEFLSRHYSLNNTGDTFQKKFYALASNLERPDIGVDVEKRLELANAKITNQGDGQVWRIGPSKIQGEFVTQVTGIMQDGFYQLSHLSGFEPAIKKSPLLTAYTQLLSMDPKYAPDFTRGTPDLIQPEAVVPVKAADAVVVVPEVKSPVEVKRLPEKRPASIKGKRVAEDFTHSASQTFKQDLEAFYNRRNLQSLHDVAWAVAMESSTHEMQKRIWADTLRTLTKANDVALKARGTHSDAYRIEIMKDTTRFIQRLITSPNYLKATTGTYTDLATIESNATMVNMLRVGQKYLPRQERLRVPGGTAPSYRP